MLRPASIALVLTACAALASPAHAAPGDLDPTFGEFGSVVLDQPGQSQADDVLVQPDRAIVVAGFELYSQGYPGYGATIYRFLRNGELDPTFGVGGRQGLGLQAVSSVSEGYSIVRGADGKLIAALEVGYDPSTIALVRLNTDGSLDSGFGVGGIVMTGVEVADYPHIVDLALTKDGRIVVVGAASPTDPTGAGGGFLVTRFLADGSPDPEFGGDGSVVVQGSTPAWATSVSLLADGRIAVAGPFTGGPSAIGYGEPVVALLRDSGQLDQEFGESGIARTRLEFGLEAGELAVDPKERIVISGQSSLGGFVARFTAAGELDPGFGYAGRAFLPGGYSSLGSLQIDRAGRIVAGGFRDSAAVVARFRRNGQPGSAFGTEGVATVQLGADFDQVAGLAIQRDGKIVTAGSAGEYVGRSEVRHLAVARYLVGRGPRDRDADGFRDRHDRCPAVPAPHHGGCPRFERTISIRFHRGGFHGRVGSRESRCVSATKVRVVQTRPGRDRVIGEARARQGHYAIDARERQGRFRAVVGATVRPRTGLCGAARSRVLELAR
jgi:uncharacterized delta-60 repeat protein